MEELRLKGQTRADRDSSCPGSGSGEDLFVHSVDRPRPWTQQVCGQKAGPRASQAPCLCFPFIVRILPKGIQFSLKGFDSSLVLFLD